MSEEPARIDFHQGTLRLWGFDLDWVRRHCLNQNLVSDTREHCLRCDAMHLADIRSIAEQHADFPIAWDIDHLRLGPIAFSDRRSIRLRDDQRAAVETFESSGRRGLIVMPTGTGKTVVAIELMMRIGRSTLVVVPVRDLMYQWHTKILEATGVDAGMIGDGVHRVSPLSVTTYDSAAIHMPRIGDRFETIIFDEAHHLSGRWRSDAARMSAATVRLGLTATPPQDPEKRESLRQCVGDVVYQQDIAGASGETLAKYQIQRIAVSMNPDEETRYRDLSRQIQEFVFDQREKDAGFRWEDTVKLIASPDDPERSAAAAGAHRAMLAKRKIEEQTSAKLRVLEDLFRLHFGQRILVFVGSNVMARMISMQFLVPCLLSHCGKRERRDLLEGFAEGRFPVLVANRVLDEGVDLPEVKVAIVLGGLSSQRQAIQRLGRVLRKGSADRDATLYEVITEGTKEVQRSRDRRRNQAYRKTAKPS